MGAEKDHPSLTIGAWLPADWHRPLTPDERQLVEQADLDILLIPENHDTWANRDAWKRAADAMDTAIYAGFEDDGWTLGLLYDPGSGRDLVYTKHSTSDNIALEREDWAPEEYLHTLDLGGVTVGTTICHDHYLSPFMRYEGLHDASVLLNLSASPVVRRKWGEVLQARAIENAAYVVCTMHGLEPDGSEPTTNKGHVFAFDPFGDQVPLLELGTDRQRTPFDTRPDSIYSFDVDPSLASDARRSLMRQEQRPSIDRVRENVYGSPGPTETSVDVRVGDDHLELRHAGDRAIYEIGESGTVQLGDETISLLAIEERVIFQPERIYEALLQVSDIEERRILFHNYWESISLPYLENAVEPVLRARCVEWCSPTLLTAGDRARAYQLANKHKDTHRIPSDEEGRFNFEIRRAFGVESALKPVDGRAEPLRELAAECTASR